MAILLCKKILMSGGSRPLYHLRYVELFSTTSQALEAHLRSLLFHK